MVSEDHLGAPTEAYLDIGDKVGDWPFKDPNFSTCHLHKYTQNNECNCGLCPLVLQHIKHSELHMIYISGFRVKFHTRTQIILG
jgi:hypothetical protein